MRERRGEREAWTAFVEGREAQRPSKYGNVRQGKYASMKEAEYAAKFAALESAGKIRDLKEQVPFILVPADGKLRAIRYIADFVYADDDGVHVVDVKGGSATKTKEYRLKRRLMLWIYEIRIEEF